MTITAYKIDPGYLKDLLAQYQGELGGEAALPRFVTQTAKILAAGKREYLRYGPYWWAVKRILTAHGVAVGEQQDPMWADEFTVRGEDGAPDDALTLLAAWEFADDNMRSSGILTNEYDLDGIAFVLYDQDQAERLR